MRRALLRVAAAAGVLFPLTHVAAQQTFEVSAIECRPITGILRAGRVERVPVFDVGDGLLIEAEDASAHFEPASLVDRPGAFGGSSLHVPDKTRGYQGARVVICFALEQPRSLQLRVRTFWPDIGGNSFFLSLDGSEREVFGNLEGAEFIGRWSWLTGPVWNLEAGLHRVEIAWREDGSWLDRVALLAPGAEIADADPARSSLVSDAPLIVETPPLALPKLSRLEAVEAPGCGPADQVWMQSADGPWDALDLPADVSEAARDRPARLRASLPPSPITLLRITYQGDPAYVEAQCGRLKMRWLIRSGALAAVTDAKTGTRFTWRSGLPFALTFWDKALGKLIEADEADVRVKLLDVRGEPPRQAIFAHYWVYPPEPYKGRVEVRISVSPDADDSRATGLAAGRITVINECKDLVVTNATFPRLAGARIGPDAADDWLTVPSWPAGRIVPHPARNAHFQGRYGGGTGIMDWHCLFEEGGPTLYMACHNRAQLSGDITSIGNAEAGTVDLALSVWPRVEPGGEWEYAPYVFGVLDGDWHAAADEYRGWLESWLDRPEPPPWLAECDGWLGTGLRVGHPTPEPFDEAIPRRYAFARRLGLDWVQFWGQMTPGPAVAPSCCNRLYFPDPLQGGEEAITRAVCVVRDAGGHIGFYTNGQAWNPRYPKLRPEYEGLLPQDALIPDWEAGAKKWAVIRADGSFVPQYGKPPGDDSPYPCGFYIMCSSARGWQDYLHHYIVDRYAKEYGVDAMYVDQVGAAAAQPCYSDNHPHQHIGEWLEGHMRNFRRLKTSGRRHERSFALATEGFGDQYGRDVDAFLISPASTVTGTEMYPFTAPELVRYTLPRHICFDGFANGNVGGREARDVLLDIFVLGNRFDVFWRPGEVADYFAEILRLRQEISPWTYQARFMDEQGLDVPEGLRAKLFRLETGPRGWLIACANPENAAGLSLRLRAPASEALHVYRAALGEPLAPYSLSRHENSVSLDVPAADASVFALLKEPPPYRIRAWAPPVVAGGDGFVELRYRPLSDMAGEGTATLDLPKGWSTAPTRFDLSRPSDVRLEYSCRAGSGPSAATAVARCDTGRASWEQELSLLITPALTMGVRPSGGGVKVVLLNEAQNPIDAEVSAESNRWTGAGPNVETVTVPALGEASVHWPGTETPTQSVQMTVSLRAGDEVRSRVVTLEPPAVDTERWSPARYEGEPVQLVEDDVLIVRTAGMDDRGGWRWETPALAPGSRWRFTCRIAAQPLAARPDEEHSGACIRVIRFHWEKRDAGTGPTVFSKPIVGSTDWREVSVDFDVPPDTGRVQIELFNWHAEGTSRWRDLTLMRAD